MPRRVGGIGRRSGPKHRGGDAPSGFDPRARQAELPLAPQRLMVVLQKGVIPVALLVALAAAGCCLPGLPVPVGRVTGALGAVGGPPMLPAERPLGGTVTVSGAAGSSYTVRVGSNGLFSLRMLAGVYTLTGRSPLFESGAVSCDAAGPVTVRGGMTTRVSVRCQER